MTFGHPSALALVPAVLACAWWLFHRRGPAAEPRLGRIPRVWADRRGLAPRAPARVRRGRGLGFAGAGVLCVIALARPQWGRVEEVRYQHAREVVVALDVSRSMLADDVTPTRLDRAKLLTESLLDAVRGDRIGLLLFAGTAFVQAPLSADTEVLRALLPQVDPSYIPQGGTRYTQMLEAAAAAFTAGDAERYLVVLSDGEALDDSWKAALPALEQRGIRVVGLGVGTSAGALVPAAGGGATKDAGGAAVLSRLEPSTLQALAAATGGTYRDAAAWVDIPELIAGTVAQGERGAFVESRSARVPDRFQWFLAPAVLCGLLSLWLEFPVVLSAPRAIRRMRLPGEAPAIAALLLGIALWASPRSVSAVGAPPPERQGRPVPSAGSALPPLPPGSSERNALEAAVGTIAAKAAIEAKDYADLATATVAYAGSAPHDAASPRTAAINDALNAVGHGERLDPQAADWPGLRQQLQQLLVPPPPSPQPEAAAGEPQDGSQQPEDGDAAPSGAGADAASQSEQGNREASSEATTAQDAGSQQPSADGTASAAGDEPSAGAPEAGQQGREQPSGTEGSSTDDVASADDQRAGNPPAEAPRPTGDTAASSGQEQTAEGNGEGAEAAAPDDASRSGAGEPPEAATGRSVGGGTVRDPRAAGVAGRAADTLAALRRADTPAVLFDRMQAAEGHAAAPPSEKDW